MGNLVIHSRKYHSYLINKGYTASGTCYYKDGEFFTPHYYQDYCCLDRLYEGEQTGYEVEQMFYFSLEGGITA